MKTLAEKKEAILEKIKRKKFRVTAKRMDWLQSLNLFPFYSPDYTLELCDLDNVNDHPPYFWQSAGHLSPDIKFKEVKKLIQRTMLEDTYIEVNNDEESEWVLELFEKAGYSGKYGCGLVPTNVFARYRVGEYIMTWDSIERKPKDAYKISISYLETLFDTKFEPKGEGFLVDLSEPQEFKLTVKFNDAPPGFVFKEDHEDIVQIIGDERDHLRKRCDEYFDEIEKLKAEVTRLSIQNGLTSARNLDLADIGDKWKRKAAGLQDIIDNLAISLQNVALKACK